VKTRPHLLQLVSKRRLKEHPVVAGFRNLRVTSQPLRLPSTTYYCILRNFAAITQTKTMARHLELPIPSSRVTPEGSFLGRA
jgi:hypothetical protein